MHLLAMTKLVTRNLKSELLSHYVIFSSFLGANVQVGYKHCQHCRLSETSWNTFIPSTNRYYIYSWHISWSFLCSRIYIYIYFAALYRYVNYYVNMMPPHIAFIVVAMSQSSYNVCLLCFVISDHRHWTCLVTLQHCNHSGMLSEYS